MRVLALSPYPLAGASARYRVYNFVTPLVEHGVELHIAPFLDEATFSRRGIVGNKDAWVLAGIAAGFLARFREALGAAGKYEAIYVHRQAFPLFQEQLDGLFTHLGLPIIFDMDDAVFTEYPIKHLLRQCSAITVGNDYLANYSVLAAPGVPVTVIPTTVNLDQYHLAPQKTYGHPVVGWIGTHSTFYQYLLPYLPDLVRTVQLRGGEFRVIASESVQADTEAAGATFIPWSLEGEVSELQQFDIGVMPLRDDEYVRGKCAFKLIQYGGVGLPSVGTAIGANRSVVQDRVSGFLTTSISQMQARIGELLDSPQMRQSMGQSARKIVEERFSLQPQAEVLAGVFRDAVERKRNVRN